MTDRIHIPQEDLVLYGMHALPAAEVATIREHLAECEDCRAELAQISGDLALAAMSAPQHPLPQGARDRFLERIGVEPERSKNVVNIAETPSRSKPQLRRAPLWRRRRRRRSSCRPPPSDGPVAWMARSAIQVRRFSFAISSSGR